MNRLKYNLCLPLLALFLLASCNGKNPISSIGPDVAEVRINTDTASTEPALQDSLPSEEDIIEQLIVPQTVDEVFDDFVNNFELKASFQRQRVEFPIEVSGSDGSRDTIQASEWQHRYLFMRQDFCSVLWNSEHEMMEFADRPQDADAAVEQFYLHSRTVTTLHFHRDDTGRWMLTTIDEKPFSQHELAGFLDFYRQFVTDSIYQHEHLAPQLRYVTMDDESEDGYVEGSIDSEQWQEFAPEMPKDAITNIRYGQRYNHPTHIVMQMHGFGDGFQALFTFRKEAGRWRLIGFEN